MAWQKWGIPCLHGSSANPFRIALFQIRDCCHLEEGCSVCTQPAYQPTFLLFLKYPSIASLFWFRFSFPPFVFITMFDSLALVPLCNAKKIEQEVNKTKQGIYGMAWHNEVFPWPRGSSATPIGIHYSKAKKMSSWSWRQPTSSKFSII